jgi:hypothetical protein
VRESEGGKRFHRKQIILKNSMAKRSCEPNLDRESDQSQFGKGQKLTCVPWHVRK